MDNQLPLGILRQATLKMDSFISDIYEVLEDPDITSEDRYQFEQIVEVSSTIQAVIINTIKREISEEDFLNENPEMDHLEPYPEYEEDILNMEI